MAMINPCLAGLTIKNTGVECSEAMLATYAIVMMPKSAFWDSSDEADFTGYLNDRLHDVAGSRWYWLFGRAAKVNGITDSPEADVYETMEDGSKSFIRNGMFNRTFMTTKGGDCFAKALQSIPHDYAFIEIDAEGKVKRLENTDGTFSGFPVNVAAAPTPELANFTKGFKNKFTLDFSPADYVNNGSIVKGDSTEDILSLKGLLDTDVLQGAGTNSTTKIYVKVRTECAQTDLVALYGATLAAVGNFVVKNGNNSTNTPSAAAVVAGEIELTGTFTTSTNITVSLAAPSVLLAAGIVGYEGVSSATCAIP